MSDGKMVHVHLLDQANERALLLERELAQIKQGWAEDDARLQRAEEGWAEASERLAQVKAERDSKEFQRENCWRSYTQAERELAEAKRQFIIEVDRSIKAVAERDTAVRDVEAALRHVEAMLDAWGCCAKCSGIQATAARAFLLSMREKADL